MVDFRDPDVLALDYWAFAKLCHTVDGLYMWEFVTTLGYEWRVIKGRQPYRWTIWIYSLTRLATLMTVITNMIAISIISQTNCQVCGSEPCVNFPTSPPSINYGSGVWVVLSAIFAAVTFASSALLFALRAIVIWNKNKGIIAAATIVCGVNILFLIQGVLGIHSSWAAAPASGTCNIPDVEVNMATIISMFITDFFLLVIMLVGLLRMHHRSASSLALGSLLWKEGFIWLFLSTSVVLLPVVFICLDLNNAFDIMFLMPSLITMSIAATRMYRSLADLCCSTDVAMDSENAAGTNCTVSNSKPTFAVPTSPKQMEMAAKTSDEKYPTSLTDKYIFDFIKTRLE